MVVGGHTWGEDTCRRGERGTIGTVVPRVMVPRGVEGGHGRGLGRGGAGRRGWWADWAVTDCRGGCGRTMVLVWMKGEGWLGSLSAPPPGCKTLAIHQVTRPPVEDSEVRSGLSEVLPGREHCALVAHGVEALRPSNAHTLFVG